jgi:23S rRNA-/tRNA-specific pseudouridylate synthase
MLQQKYLLREVKSECIKPKSIDLDIIYEDDDIINIINKQSGLLKPPGAENHDDTMLCFCLCTLQECIF